MQCSKTPPPEPPTTQPNGLPLATQEGKNTFGCFWNDTLWLPEDGLSGPAIYFTYSPDSNWIVGAFSNDSKKESISIALKDVKLGYNEYEYKYPNSFDIYKRPLLNYKISGISKFKINVKRFDKPDKGKTKGVLSGTFNGVFYKRINSNGIDTFNFINIKKAVFDLQLN
jgi:hypothetical protein